MLSSARVVLTRGWRARRQAVPEETHDATDQRGGVLPRYGGAAEWKVGAGEQRGDAANERIGTSTRIRIAPPKSLASTSEKYGASVWRGAWSAERVGVAAQRVESTAWRGDASPVRGDASAVRGDASPVSADASVVRGDTSVERGGASAETVHAIARKAGATEQSGESAGRSDMSTN